jgi:phosphocarrier protein FPr
MIGLVLVSHSRALALAVQELARAMTGPDLPLAIAAGVGENHAELGTDAVEICEAISSVDSLDGIVVLMDMGSAILSAEMALDLMDASLRPRVHFCAAPFVEGAVAAAVTAQAGMPVEAVLAEALGSLKQKNAALKPAGDTAQSRADVSPLPAVAAQKSIRATVRNAHGLHARPAARLIAETRHFDAEITVRNLTNSRGPVSVKSLSSLASLEVLAGHEVEFAASGADAPAALARIRQLVQENFGEALSPPFSKKPASAKTMERSSISAGPIVVCEGAALGPAFHLQSSRREMKRQETDDVAGEISRLERAVSEVRKTLEQRRAAMSASVGTDRAQIYEAQALALQDPELIDSAVNLIKAQKLDAASAWDAANRQVIARYEALSDSYLRERATDLEDVGEQVLERLSVRKDSDFSFTDPSILIANNLTPTQVAAIPRDRVLGVLLLNGGPTAHSSILLRALGIPTMVQARASLPAAPLVGTRLIAFDTASRTVWVDPAANVTEKIRSRQKQDRRRDEEEKLASPLPGRTADGVRIEVFANIGAGAEVAPALARGAEGVGLLRTEFLFLERTTAPDEEEQVAAIRAATEPLKGRPLIVRTLDIGGDKPLPYLSLPAEDNPFLGVRAVRLGFLQPELFTTHLRAILRAAHGHDVRIMFPMIADTADLARARECLAVAHRSLEQQGRAHAWPISTGIMVEIPSAALNAEQLAEQADFFSIGTNDLTQYTLAADRGNPALATYHDARHPAVLRLIDLVARGARKRGRLVAVCGEAAADETAAALFVGLGVRELSMTATSIPRIKALLRRTSLACLEARAQRALGCSTAAEVRSLESADPG